MSNSGNKPINIKEATRKIEVDHRIPLQHYYKIADNLLNQADVYRQEKNIMALYILLLRYAGLVTETIPFHREYTTSNHREKAYYRKKLLDVIRELERLKPEVEREVSKVNREHTLKQLFRHASSSRQPPLSRMASLWPDNKRMERLSRTIIIGPVTTPEAVVVPSAPPIETLVIDDDASLQSGPADESSFGDSSSSKAENLSKKRHDEGGSSSIAASSCIICYEASIEGACVPCGHMAGCMSCLNEIKSNNWGCPICRTHIDLVLRLYSV